MFDINNRYPNHLQRGELARNNSHEKYASSRRLHILLGTVSIIAFLSAQSPVIAEVMRSHDIERDSSRHVAPRNASLAIWEALGDPIHAQLRVDVRGDRLALPMQVRHQSLIPEALSREDEPSRKLLTGKPNDFSEYVVIQMSDIEGAPVPLPVRSKMSYVLPAVTSTVVKPTGRLLKSTAEGAYYAVPHVARAAWWTAKKTVEALGATVSAIDDAALYGVDAVRDVHAGRATAGDKGWDAGKKTSAAVGKTFKWFGNTLIEAVESAVPPIWSGMKWTAEETWNNTTAAAKDVWDAYGREVWSSVKSTAARASTYIQDKFASGVATVKAGVSRLAAGVSSGVKSAWKWLTS